MDAAGVVRQGLVGGIVALLSLALLVYVGRGEAARTYPQFQIAKMTAQAELVRHALGRHLHAGLPLRQIPGFRQIAEPILASDSSLAAIVVHDATGRLFVAGDPLVPRLPALAAGEPSMRRDTQWLQLELPLRSRFETVGALTVTMPLAAASGVTSVRLPWLAGGVLALSTLYGLLAAALAGRTTRVPWLALAYAAVFTLAAGAVVASLVALYAEGAQAKARALAASLAQRLQPAVSYGIDLAELSGLDRAIAEYRILNPDIEAVAVLIGDTAVLHTDPVSIGRAWQAGAGRYAYIAPVGEAASGEVRVAVALPAAVVWRAVARSIKNFAALFIASGLLAALFLQLGRTLAAGPDVAPTAEPAPLARLRPIFFLAVFVESLGAGFLPQLIAMAAGATGLGESAGGAAFAVYFLCFLIVLVPASRAVEQHGARPFILAGASCIAAAMLVQALAPAYASLVAARAMAGTGQGLLFIGVQSALLEHAPAGQRTRAAAIIVLGFNGGMIAGAAIGSLLVEDLGPRGVFLIGAAIAMLLVAYTGLVVGGRAPTTTRSAERSRPLMDLVRALGSGAFLRALLLVGAPAKAVLTGVIGFALPILLSGAEWRPEDVGQVIMLYGCGVLVAGGPAARLVDRGQRSGLVVGAGGIGAGLALLLMSAGMTVPILAGVLLLGLAHGLIHAPVITYVTEACAEVQLGAGGAAALYRVVERVGHALGPLLAGQLLALTGAGMTMLAWIGAALLAASVLFVVPLARENRGQAA